MASNSSKFLSILAGMVLGGLALGLASAPVAAQSSAARSPYASNSNQSAVDAEVQAIMQMMRDEGIDIDARIARARASCRDEITSDTAEASDAGEPTEAEIEEAFEGCALAKEGVVYAQAINEMNANRVNVFNDAMAQHNAQVAEAARKQREYELSLQGHSAEVAEIERKQQEFAREQQQYEADLAAHKKLLAEGGFTDAPAPTRSRAIAQNTAPEPTPSAAEVQVAAAAPPPPVQTRVADRSAPTQAPAQVAAQVPAKAPVQAPAQAPASTTPALAQNTVPSTVPQTANSSPGLARGAGPPRGYGKKLSGRPPSSFQEDIELAVTKASGPRIALIIGNERYEGSMGALSNPVNDAVLISATLRSLGFDVEILRDGTQREMKDAVRRLGDRLQEAGDNATGLFYYAGHGVQSKGQNFLVPVGSVIDAESDLELEAVKADAILAQMEEAYVSTRIVILDACRNMPLRRRTRNGSRGLARMETPNGSFVAYSTSPGNTAADGGGVNSPFAESLAEQMLVPDRPIEVTFREVRRQVVEVTSGDQVPWNSSSLLDTFSFAQTR